MNETSCYPRPCLKSLDIPSVQTELLKVICTANGTPQSWDILGPFGSICLPSGRYHLSSITLVVYCSWSSSIMCIFVHTSKSKRTRQCCESGKDTAVLRAQRSYLSSGFTTPSVHTTDKRCFEVQIVAHLQSTMMGFVHTQTYTCS